MFNSPVALLFTPIQLQASSPATSKVHQIYSAVTDVTVMALIDSPAFAR